MYVHGNKSNYDVFIVYNIFVSKYFSFASISADTQIICVYLKVCIIVNFKRVRLNIII